MAENLISICIGLVADDHNYDIGVHIRLTANLVLLHSLYRFWSGHLAPEAPMQNTIGVEVAMEITLSDDLSSQVEQELVSGRFRSTDELIEAAVRQYLDDQRRAVGRRAALRSIGDAVDRAGLYDRAIAPGK